MSEKTVDPSVFRNMLVRLKADGANTDPQKLAEIFLLADRLDERERFEPLLDMLRPRLRTISDRIARPASLGRVLFLPIEYLLVPSSSWRAGHLTIPRSALQPVIQMLPLALGADHPRLASELVGRTMKDIDALMGVGDILWPRMSQVLLGVAQGQTELPSPRNLPMSEAMFRRFCRAMGEPLSVGGLLAEIVLKEPTAERFADLAETALVAMAGLSSPDAVRRIALICLISCGRRQLPPSFLSAVLRRANVSDGEDVLAPALAATIEALEMSIEAEFRVLESAPLDLSRRAVALADRIATALEDRLLARTPERAREVKALAMRCEELFRNVIDQAISDICRKRLEELAQASEVRDADIAELERSTRSLVDVIRAVRMLSPRASWPEAVCQHGAAQMIAFGKSLPSGCPPNRLGRRDVARLVEILAGPDTAITLENGHTPA